jgi:hypothetical protein
MDVLAKGAGEQVPEANPYLSHNHTTLDANKSKQGTTYGFINSRLTRKPRPKVGAFYWTALAPEIVNSGREEQGSVSV